jgi:hypothetical protein
MRFSGRDTILFNFRLNFDPVPIHRPFGDPGASVVQIGQKATFLWVLVRGCSVFRMMYISKASSEILCGATCLRTSTCLSLLPPGTNPESFVRPVETE